MRREAAGTEKGHRPHLPPHSKSVRPTSTSASGTRSRSSRGNTIVASLKGLTPVRTPPMPSSASRERTWSFDDGTANNSSDSESESETSSSEESDDSSEETFYRDYRSNLRSSLLVAQHANRLRSVTHDMERFIRYMTNELGVDEKDADFAPFAMNVHDLSLTNIFVDPENRSTIVSYLFPLLYPCAILNFYVR